jgi:hypothetical protein
VFDHIPADTLVLWEVHNLADENLKGNVEKLRLSLIDDESPEVSTPYQNEKEIQLLLPVRNFLGAPCERTRTHYSQAAAIQISH